jgi:hypothetical protein
VTEFVEDDERFRWGLYLHAFKYQLKIKVVIKVYNSGSSPVVCKGGLHHLVTGMPAPLVFFVFYFFKCPLGCLNCAAQLSFLLARLQAAHGSLCTGSQNKIFTVGWVFMFIL